MTAPVEFFFDFSSPYGYLASERIEGIASRHGRSVLWHPFLVGAAMKVSERKPLLSIPLIGDYAVHDIERFSRYWNIPLAIPSHWPIATVAACRAFYLVARTDQAGGYSWHRRCIVPISVMTGIFPFPKPLSLSLLKQGLILLILPKVFSRRISSRRFARSTMRR